MRVRDAEFLRSLIPVNTPLTVHATLRGAAPPVALYAFDVRLADEVLVRGEITTYAGGPTGTGA
ncbi:MAG: hypothetical protein R2712_20565 [Vicinamibacterales bacterium]